MNILIDTHIFLWLLFSISKIKSKHLEILSDLDNDIYVSSISIAEIMIKKSLNKLDVDFDLEYSLKKLDARVLDFDANSALVLGSLPYHHKDLFDRMIISQALTKKYKLMSVDGKFSKYDCELL